MPLLEICLCWFGEIEISVDIKLTRYYLAILLYLIVLWESIMIIIGSVDIYFGSAFPMHADTWRTGITCKVAGAFSIISSEASVFFVMLISIDRFICIRFPYSTRKLTQN